MRALNRRMRPAGTPARPDYCRELIIVNGWLVPCILAPGHLPAEHLPSPYLEYVPNDAALR